VVDAAGLSQALAAVASDLTALERRFALVGGLAVSARAEVRFTRDVDLAVASTGDEDAEQLVHAMTTRGYQVRATVEQEAVGRLSTVRLLSPAGVKVDILFASSGIEAEIVERAEWLDHVEGRLPVARAEELVATKVLSADADRLQDHLDFRSLLSVAAVDLDAVRDDLRLIEARGFARQQDLIAKLNSMLASLPSS